MPAAKKTTKKDTKATSKKVAKNTLIKDTSAFEAQLNTFKEAVSNSSEKDNVILNSLITDFERFKKINDHFYKQLEENGYTFVESGVVKPSPLIAMYNKNSASMIKICESLNSYMKELLASNDDTW